MALHGSIAAVGGSEAHASQMGTYGPREATFREAGLSLPNRGWHPSLTSVGPCLATWWDFFRDNFRVADHPDGTSLDALMEGSTSGTMSCAVRRARPIVSDVAGKPSSESSTAGGLV
jgi:hypothetical protein